jgi:transposase
VRYVPAGSLCTASAEQIFPRAASNGIVSNSPYTPLAIMTASPIASVRVFDPSSRYVRCAPNAVDDRTDHHADRSSTSGPSSYALGNLVRFILLPGHRFDTVGVAPLIKDIEFGGLIADKAFDSNWIIEDMNERKAKIVISQHPRRAKPLDIDTDIYKWRHLIENFFGKLKEFKRIAMRSDKTDSSFEAMIYLATAVIHSR